MATRISLGVVDPKVFTCELAPYAEYGIPIGTFYPDSPADAEGSSALEDLRRRRLAFFTFDEAGKPKWALRDLNYLGEPVKKALPKIKYGPRDCTKNRHVDLFLEFRNQDLDAFERTAFSWLAKIHCLNVQWAWPTYKIMHDEPHRRLFREHQPKRLATGAYDVPTFRKADGTEDIELQELFMKKLEDVYSWERLLRYDIDTHSGNHTPLKHAQQRFRLAIEFADMMQTLLQNTEIRCVMNMMFPPEPEDSDVVAGASDAVADDSDSDSEVPDFLDPESDSDADGPDTGVPNPGVPSITITPSEEDAAAPAAAATPAYPTPGFLGVPSPARYVPVSTTAGDEQVASFPLLSQAIDPMLGVDDSATDWEQEDVPEELQQAVLSLQPYQPQAPPGVPFDFYGEWLSPEQDMYPLPLGEEDMYPEPPQ